MPIIGLEKFQTHIDQGKDRVLEKGKSVRIVNGAFGTGEDCYGIVEEITEPKNGGIFTKFEGCSYLYKGYPNVKILSALRQPKTTFRIFRQILLIKFVRRILLILYFVHKKSAEKFVLKLADICIKGPYNGLKPYILYKTKYCKSIREIYRVLTLLIEEIKSPKLRELALKIRDLICMFLEHDSAYKFRKQDILPEIDKEKLKENPVKEMNRVFDILYQREVVGMQFNKYREIRKVLISILRFSPKARKLFVEYILELDFDKIRLDEADWYFSLRREDYIFGCISFKDRLKEAEKIDKEKNHYRPKIRTMKPNHIKILDMEEAKT